MSRPARCQRRTDYARWHGEPDARLGHLFTSSIEGVVVCSWCGKPRPA